MALDDLSGRDDVFEGLEEVFLRDMGSSGIEHLEVAPHISQVGHQRLSTHEDKAAEWELL